MLQTSYIPNQHRKWSWFDEQGWQGLASVPYVKQNGWDPLKYASNPVLDAGSAGQFDDVGVTFPDIRLDIANRRQLLYYVGRPQAGWTNAKIGVAYGDNGISWIKYAGNPIITLDTWSSDRVDGASVIIDPAETNTSKRFKMIYRGYNTVTFRPGLAYSPDGLVWTKYAGNPLTGFPANFFGTPSWVKSGALYLCFYGGSANMIRLAIEERLAKIETSQMTKRI